MPASVSGSKTVNVAAAPHLSASALTALLAKAVENMTVAELMTIEDAIRRVPGGGNPAATIGSLLA